MLKKSIILVGVFASLSAAADCVATYDREIAKIGNAFEKVETNAISSAGGAIVAGGAMGNGVSPGKALSTGAAVAGGASTSYERLGAHKMQNLIKAKQLIEEAKVGVGLRVAKFTAEVNIELLRKGSLLQLSPKEVAALINLSNSRYEFCQADAQNLNDMKSIVLSYIRE